MALTPPFFLPQHAIPALQFCYTQRIIGEQRTGQYWVDDKMKIIYSKHYNINLGLLNYLHPFDGTKFQTIHDGLKQHDHIEFMEPSAPASMGIIDEFLSRIMRHRVRDKNAIFQALEVPRLPFINFSFLDRKILTPMRWAVAA